MRFMRINILQHRTFEKDKFSEDSSLFGRIRFMREGTRNVSGFLLG